MCDKQTDEQKTKIEAQVESLFMHEEKKFESLVLKNTTEDALKRFSKLIDWPQKILDKYSDLEANLNNAIFDYFIGKKADYGVADFLTQCDEQEIPEWIRNACMELKAICEPEPNGNGCSDDEVTNIEEDEANP